jgi:hypothetical protein
MQWFQGRHRLTKIGTAVDPFYSLRSARILRGPERREVHRRQRNHDQHERRYAVDGEIDHSQVPPCRSPNAKAPVCLFSSLSAARLRRA